jgi:DHA1 family multidrug resistance protein B-like MFS transporter
MTNAETTRQGLGATLWRSHRNIKLRLGIGFVNRLLLAMTGPLMAIYLAERFGEVRAGLLLAIVVVVTMACTIAGGHWADSRGRRPTLLRTEFGVGIGYLGMALANTPWFHSPVMTYAFYLVSACASGIGLPANDAVIMDVATPALRTSIYTINYWSLNLAFAIGAMAGGFFYHGHFLELLAGGSVLTAGVFAVTSFWLEETAPGLGKKASAAIGRFRRVWENYRHAAKDRVFTKLVAAAILITAIELQLTYYVGIKLAAGFPYQRVIDAGGWHVAADGVRMLGILRTLNTVLVVLLALVATRVFGRLPENVRMHAGLVMFTGGFMVMAVSRNAWVLIAVTLVYTVGELMNVPVRQAIMADIIDPTMRARYMALYGLRPRAGALIAALCVVAGSVLTPWVMAAIFGVMGAASMYLMRVPSRMRRVRLARFAYQAADAELTSAITQRLPILKEGV